MTETRSRLKRVGTKELTFELFEFEFKDEADRNEYLANPRDYTIRLYEAEGIPVRQVFVEAGEQGNSESMKASQWHCLAPPEEKSKIMTVISE